MLLKCIEEVTTKSSHDILSDHLYNYLIAGEDHRFWFHFGVDPIGLLRAIWRTKVYKKREGGSTIAMQLVRTLTKNYQLSTSRKLKEIYLATKLTHTFEKKEILKTYLLVAYYGWSMHGIKQACARLKLDPKNLTPYDAASLIARLKYPEPRHYSNIKKAKIDSRTNHILKRFNNFNLERKNGTI